VNEAIDIDLRDVLVPDQCPKCKKDASIHFDIPGYVFNECEDCEIEWKLVVEGAFTAQQIIEGNK
jgi:hypothetical protein